MKWYIRMNDGTIIKDFDLHDEFNIRQAIFMEHGEWPFIFIETDFLRHYNYCQHIDGFNYWGSSSSLRSEEKRVSKEKK